MMQLVSILCLSALVPYITFSFIFTIIIINFMYINHRSIWPAIGLFQGLVTVIKLHKSKVHSNYVNEGDK